jgi:hypothetical protein
MSKVGYFPKGETFLQFKAWADAQGAAPGDIVERLAKPAKLAAEMRSLEAIRDSRQKGVEGADWPADPRRRALLRFAFCDVGSAKPLVLELFARREAGAIDEDTLLECLADLNSLLIRRATTGANTRSYDRRFVEIAKRLDTQVREHMHREFHRLGWPSDGEFADALLHQPIYRTDPLKARLLLEELERAAAGREHVQLARLQIEHVIPQRLTGAAAAAWKEMLGDGWRTEHASCVHALGNLTLTGYNQVMSNHSFAAKRESLGKSRLALNEHFKGRRRWDGPCVRERGSLLAAELVRLFPVVGEPCAGDDVDDVADTLERTGRADATRAFWQRVLDHVSSIDGEPCDGVPTGKAYSVIRTRYRSFRMIPWIDRRDDSIGVMASFNGDEGDRNFATVRADRPAIEERFGARIGERQRGQRGQAPHFIVKQQGAGLGSAVGDSRAIEWLAENLIKLREAVYPSLEGAGASVRSSAGKASRGERFQWFAELLSTARERTPLHARRSALNGPWCTVSAGVLGVQYTYWVAREHSRAEVSFGVDRRDPGLPKRRFSWMERHRSRIERELPGLEWVNDQAHDSARVTMVIPGGFASPREEWSAIHRRCIDAMIRLHEVMQPLVESEEFRRL